MSVLESVDKSELKDMLGKGWLTHDGMWFLHTSQAFGIDQANTLNRAAIRSIAPIEINRVKKILGAGEGDFESFEDLREFLLNAFELILPGSVSRGFSFSASSGNTLRWEWEKGECFAFKGMTHAGMIDDYRCGVIYRIACWLDALGVNHSIDPSIDACIMHTTGGCSGDIRVHPDE
jgi:hypothetical protein